MLATASDVPTTSRIEHSTLIGSEHCPRSAGHGEMTPPEVRSDRTVVGKQHQVGFACRSQPVPALRWKAISIVGAGMFDRMNGIGAHEVDVRSPEHRQTLATCEAHIERVLWAFRERRRPEARHAIPLHSRVQSPWRGGGRHLEHSRRSSFALPIVPDFVREELEGARHFRQKNAACCDINTAGTGCRSASCGER